MEKVREQAHELELRMIRILVFIDDNETKSLPPACEDIFAARGTPNVAIADGIVRQRHNSLGGNALWLYTADGNAFYYAHLDAYEGVWNSDEARVVTKGEVIGYTGNTGNAAGGPTHTHFQIHPGEVLGLAGESGSGKSTVAHAILRVLRPPAVITGGDAWGPKPDALHRRSALLCSRHAASSHDAGSSPVCNRNPCGNRVRSNPSRIFQSTGFTPAARNS